jgi:hypothetical protein
MLRAQRLFHRVLAVAWLWVAAGPAVAQALWWDDLPLFVHYDDPLVVRSYGASASINSSMHAPSWGLYGQRVSFMPDMLGYFSYMGVRTICYNETFGTVICFVRELGPHNGEYYTLKNTHWTWENYSGGTVVWVGPQNWFDDEAFARPYTRTHPVYGGSPMRYPDGTVATGYIGDPTNPLNSRVLDAGCAKDILGALHQSDGLEPTNGPHTGLIVVNGIYTGHVGPAKDAACPMWIDLARASAKLSAASGVDGMWSDNYGGGDSFYWPAPVNAAFGDWSVALFREYLADHFDPSELAAMGVADVATFDVRAALRAQCVAWGGDDTRLCLTNVKGRSTVGSSPA